MAPSRRHSCNIRSQPRRDFSWSGDPSSIRRMSAFHAGAKGAVIGGHEHLLPMVGGKQLVGDVDDRVHKQTQDVTQETADETANGLADDTTQRATRRRADNTSDDAAGRLRDTFKHGHFPPDACDETTNVDPVNTLITFVQAPHWGLPYLGFSRG